MNAKGPSICLYCAGLQSLQSLLYIVVLNILNLPFVNMTIPPIYRVFHQQLQQFSGFLKKKDRGYAKEGRKK